MQTLPIITDCNDCGACCMTQCSPPMYVLAIVRPRDFDADDEDLLRVQSLPAELKQTLLDYVSDLRNNHIEDESPCIWFDQQTRRCKYYEHRPSICRDFPVGGEDCQNWRELHNNKVPC